MGINWVTFFAQIVNLFVLVWLLKRFLYRPILNAVEKRQAEITSKVNKAREEYDFAQKEHQKLQKQQKDFAVQKQTLFDEATRQAEEYKQTQIDLIHKETNDMRKKMQEDLNRENESMHMIIRNMLAENFVSLSQKIMAELSGLSALEQSLLLFEKKVEKLSKSDKEKIKNIYEKQNIIIITSSDILSEKMQKRLALFISKSFALKLPLKMRFEKDESLILGIVMSLGDVSLEWNLKSYLDDYQTNLNNALTGLIVKE